MRAAHAVLELGQCLLVGAYRMAAGKAKAMTAGEELMPHRDPLVEYEAFALPAAFFRGNGLEVLENAALEVIDRFETLHAHERGGFLAANAAGAEHRDPRLVGEQAAGCGFPADPFG